MAWDAELFALFDDLERRAELQFTAERAAELADRSRAEYAVVTWASRLMASTGAQVTLAVHGVGPVAGSLERVSDGWCLVRSPARDWIVCWAAIGAVEGAAGRSVPELAWSPLARLGLRSALRGLADAGQDCVLHLVDGARYDATVGRVGHDFFEAKVGEGRELLVRFAALAAVSSREA
jgi:hypothetical protein